MTGTGDASPSPAPSASALGPAPASAAAVFAERLGLASRFAERLAADGVLRGLVGPREVGRLWERHVLNSAVVTQLLPRAARVVDVGSGAGLPGLAMAIRRDDLQVDLVEPMQRRVDFLVEMVAELGLRSAVRVVRGRAEDADVVAEVGNSDWVVARAVAPLDRLGRWCLPLLTPGGRLLALKGARVRDEVAAHRQTLLALGADAVEVQRVGSEWPEVATWVVAVRRAPSRRTGRRRVRS